MLQALPPQPVILTVLSAGDEVGLYLTFRRAPGGHVLARGSLAGLGRPYQRPRRGGPRWTPRAPPGLPRSQLAEGAGVTGDTDAAGVIEVAAVDDHPVIRDGLAAWVAAPGSGIRVIGMVATVDALLAGPGRQAHVVLLDLDLGDGSTAERNVAVIRAAGPAVLVLSASDRPPTVRDAIRAGALGYVLKNEETSHVRAAIKAVAAGKDWISPRLAYIFATDDAPDRPALSAQETRALRLYATGIADEAGSPPDVH